MHRHVLKCVRAVLLAGGLLGAVAGEHADAAFYEGKQITLVVGTAPGGGYDDYMRMLIPFLQERIPGRPNIVVQSRPGAAGLNAAAYVYNAAPKDGTVIAICPSVFILAEALEPAKARFESRKFGWIGTITTMTHVLAVMKTSGIASIEDAKTKQGILGATTATGADFLEAALVNDLLDTKFKIVTGFNSGSREIALAMERGEVDGFANSWDSWKATRSNWVAEGKLNFLLQIGARLSELPQAPNFLDLARTERQKAAVELLGLIQTVGRSLFLPPGVPQERLDELRQAFDATMRDKAFVEAMQARNLDVQPRTGSALQADIDRVLANKDNAAADILAAAKKAQAR